MALKLSTKEMKSYLHRVWDKRCCRLLSSYPPGVSPCWEFSDSDYVPRSCSWHAAKNNKVHVNALRIEFEKDPRKILSELTEEELLTPPTPEEVSKYLDFINIDIDPEQRFLEVHRDHVLHKRVLAEAKKLSDEFMGLQKQKQFLQDKLNNMNMRSDSRRRELEERRTFDEKYAVLRIESLKKELTLVKEEVATSQEKLSENFFLYFKQLVGKEVVVELDGSIVVRGKLLRCNESLDMVLETAEVVNQEKCHHEYHFKGYDVSAVTPPDDSVWPLFPPVKPYKIG